MIETLFILLVVFQVKHFLCDYPLQTEYVLGKMEPYFWEIPLAAHAGVHATATFIIALVFANPYIAALTAVMDFVIHFTVDRIKASPNMGGKFKPDQKQFWWALGADQMVHHLTHYWIIAIILGVL